MHSYPQHVAPSTTDYCLAPGCRINPTSDTALAAAILGAPLARHAVPGTDLCNWHQAQIPRILNDLVRLWPDLEAALYRKTGGSQNDRVQTSGIVDISQSWNPAVSEIMADVTEWTTRLARTVLDDFTLPAASVDTVVQKSIVFAANPEDGSSVVQKTQTRTTVHTHRLASVTGTRMQLSVLGRHYAHWLASYPGLGSSILADAFEHRYAVTKALDSTSVRRVRFPAAQCGHVAVDEQLGALSCMGSMIAVFPDPDDLRPTVVMCSIHPKTHPQFTPDQFMSWGPDA